MHRSVGRLVSILYRKNQVYLNMALKRYNLTASELPILLYLFHHNGVSQEELSTFLLIDKASTARVVHSLLEKEFIRKERDNDDRRANKIFLTDKALKHKDNILPILQQWTNFLTEGLDEQSVNIMFGVLEEMIKKLETNDFREMGNIE
ncbi:MarR family winged helix-turn-helix transcriptional regulator [Anaerotignum sp.]|uniref:MarR family winged helix-turn-helix transcriptional regulator n=1 Tax=Anaerotignum sp. TaxID=2039241 RepID=UPI0028AC1EB5|nr:MarR family transcriptional regulator [Anaerotignum sp.]